MSKKPEIKQSEALKFTRDYMFDNLRAVLILLVVWGHLLTSLKSDYNSVRIIYIFVFFFHMPAMAFISGYFSKNLDKIRNNAFVTLLVPYLILNFFNYLFKIYVMGEKMSGFRFLKPYWGLWYLLALFLWKFFLKDLIRIRFLLPLSFAFAVLSGFSKEFSEYLGLGRVVCFLPFFLLGYYMTAEHVATIRRLPKLLFAAAVAAVAALSAYLAFHRWFGVENLFLRKNYSQDSELKGMVLRILVYIVAVVMIISITNLMTAKKSFLSYLGRSTLTVYILHLFTIPVLEKLNILSKHPYLYLLYSILAAVLITYVYSLPIVVKVYDFCLSKLSGLLLRKDIGA